MWCCRTSVLCLQYEKQIFLDKNLVILKLFQLLLSFLSPLNKLVTFTPIFLIISFLEASDCVSLLNIFLLVLIFHEVLCPKLGTVLQLRPYSCWAERTVCNVQKQQIFFPFPLLLSEMGLFNVSRKQSVLCHKFVPQKTPWSFGNIWVLCALNHCPSLCSACSWVNSYTHFRNNVDVHNDSLCGRMGWDSLGLPLLLQSQPDHGLAFWHLIPYKICLV